MAYGARQDVGWVQAWSNGSYQVSNYVIYKQDLDARKLQITLANQECCSLTAYHTFHNVSVNNGYGWQSMGGGVVDVADSVNVPAGNCWIHSGDRFAVIEVKYNDDGSVPNIVMNTKFIAGINQYNTPEFDWISTNITNRFPSISPIKPESPPIINVENITSNSATIYWYFLEDAVKYNIYLNGELVASTESDSYTFENLKPKTEYNVQATSVNSYNQESDKSELLVFETLEDQAKVKINVNGQTKDGLVFVNVNGVSKKVKKIFVNVNGQAKEVAV